MKTIRLIFALLALSISAYAQDNVLNIPMTEDRWEFDSGSVDFIEHRSVPAIRGLNGGAAVFLKDFEFTDGTIEYDVELNDPSFSGISFRLSKDRLETENFYIRSFWPVSPHNRTTLQYATVVDTMSLWDLTDDYQAAATIHRQGWNHVKLVISGKQMKVYVNDMNRHAMHVPILEGTMKSGDISLSGNAIFANLQIWPGATEGLSPEPGYDPTYNDSRYLRNWQVTEPISFPFDRAMVMELPSMFGGDVNSDLPDSLTQWTPISAEYRALVNLSRPYGLTEAGERRLVWLKTTIESDKEQKRRLDLGFSDEIWVFVNGQILLTDKNYFGTPSAKEPRARCTIDNSSVMLPLQEGENELLIGVANNFYGWGIIARLDDTEGLSLQ